MQHGGITPSHRRITRGARLADLMFVLLSILSGMTIIAAVEYYMQLRKVEMEYERARNAVDDIVMSFNRQFKNEGAKLETLGYKVEASGSRSDSALKKASQLDGMMRVIEGRIVGQEDIIKSIPTRLADLEKRTTDIASSYEAVASKIVTLEQQAMELRSSPETHLEGVIPLRRDKAMAQLTGTEIAVLEFLASEGGKTAPEIKERVKLSREHTARLMKKLYEEGYLERVTLKIPFRYSIKKEMEKLLKKSEGQSA